MLGAVVDQSDWRLQGQEAYRQGVVLVKRAWRRYAKNPNWDHDHCEFCHAKFSLADGDLAAGYSTLDAYRWICTQCFDDFAGLFKWEVASGPEQSDA